MPTQDIQNLHQTRSPARFAILFVAFLTLPLHHKNHARIIPASAHMPHLPPLLGATPPPAQKAERKRRHKRCECEPDKCRIRLCFSAPVGAIGGQIDLTIFILAAIDDDVVEKVGTHIVGIIAGAGMCAQCCCHSLFHIRTVSGARAHCIRTVESEEGGLTTPPAKVKSMDNPSKATITTPPSAPMKSPAMPIRLMTISQMLRKTS